ncbi:MAG: S6e family ribosomal protein [archaeon]|jgi:small subunit ribosomal protein S6e
MKFVISDQKTGKGYTASQEQELFLGKKIGEVVKLDELGLAGYEGKITGGSDKQGFPMNVSMVGSARKKIFTKGAAGFRATKKGERKRISVRGNTISNEIAQLNIVVTKVGAVDISQILAKKEATGDDALSAKERLIKKSLEQAGSEELGSGVKKAKH